MKEYLKIVLKNLTIHPERINNCNISKRLLLVSLGLLSVLTVAALSGFVGYKLCESKVVDTCDDTQDKVFLTSESDDTSSPTSDNNDADTTEDSAKEDDSVEDTDPLVLTVPDLSKILRANKDTCGDIKFKENLAADYESALSIFTKLMEDEYTEWCPDQPCYDVSIDSKKAQEVRDQDGKLVEIDLYILTIIDLDSGTSQVAVYDAIDEYGNWYEFDFAGCAD